LDESLAIMSLIHNDDNIMAIDEDPQGKNRLDVDTEELGASRDVYV